MPTESPFLKAKIAAPGDETKVYPAEVDSPRTLTIDKFLEEKTLTVKARAASYEAKSGELGKVEKTGETVTLPPATTANLLIGIWSAVAETKVTTSGGSHINGDFITEEAAIRLTLNQHVLLQSDGGGHWIIIAGEPKREQKYEAYKAFSQGEMEAGIEPSSTRPTWVFLTTGNWAVGNKVYVGGVELSIVTAGNPGTVPVLCPPGQKVKATLKASGGWPRPQGGPDMTQRNDRFVSGPTPIRPTHPDRQAWGKLADAIDSALADDLSASVRATLLRSRAHVYSLARRPLVHPAVHEPDALVRLAERGRA